MKERILFLLFFISLSPNIFSKYAQVIFVRGDVTQLAPGELLARKVNKDDRLEIDASILTGSKSFIKMKLQDGSHISIGPDSKIILEKLGATEKDASLIDLLKGSLRSDIEKSATGNMNFFIKTKTAAIGVRGTEFETVYGPTSGVTSLLTYKGSVSMTHIKELDKVKSKKMKNIKYERESDLDSSLDIKEEVATEEMIDPIKKMEMALNKDSASTVKGGQISQTIDSMETVGRPTLINPVQLNLLYENSEFNEADTKGEKADLASEQLKLKSDPIDIPAEGVFDKDKGIYAPKAGGFFDRKTGLYIPPSADALYDQKNQVYVDKEIGNVDAKTGDYMAPLGLEIDPLKGFVKKQFKEGTPSELLAKVEQNQKKLNSVLDQAVVVGDGPDEQGDNRKRYLSYRELISKNVVTFSIAALDQNFKMTNSSNGISFDKSSESAKALNLGLSFDSGSRIKPFIDFTLGFNKFSQSGNTQTAQYGDKLTGLGLGLKYSIYPHWNLFTTFQMKQEYVIHFTSANNIISSQFERFSIPKWNIGIQGEWYRYKKLSAEVQAYLGTNLGKTSGDIKVDMGFQYGVNLGLRYWPSKSWYLISQIFNLEESYTISGSNYFYEYDASRNTFGLLLGVGSYF
jgi:hypothetical protein